MRFSTDCLKNRLFVLLSFVTAEIFQSSGKHSCATELILYTISVGLGIFKTHEYTLSSFIMFGIIRYSRLPTLLEPHSFGTRIEHPYAQSWIHARYRCQNCYRYLGTIMFCLNWLKFFSSQADKKSGLIPFFVSLKC